MLRLLLCFSAALACSAACKPAPPVDEDNIPQVMRKRLAVAAFNARYMVVASMNPFYLRGDFDGDGHMDYVFLIQSRSSCKAGFAIWMSTKFYVLGADTPFLTGSAASEDLSFLGAWQVYDKRPVGKGATDEPPPRLLGDAILAEVKESASGLIYWTPKGFRWYQQGD